MVKRGVFLRLLSSIVCLAAIAAAAYTVPANNRVKFNLDVGWRVYQGDPTGAQGTINDSTATGWTIQTLPYAWNGTQAFSNASSVSTGIAWYRRHFKLPASYSGEKVFLEIEEVRQAGQVYCNGTSVGIHENGVVGFGVDLTPYVTFGGADNVIAVRTNNAEGYTETAGNNVGTAYQWDDGSYTTNFGGITQNAYLHVAPTLYQTLPLYSNLSTIGVYVYGSNYNISGKSATITAQSQVKNETTTAQTVGYVADIVDASGNLVQRLTGASKVVNAGIMDTLVASGSVSGLNFWSFGYGYLYNVYTMLVINGDTTDVVKTTTGFRQEVNGPGGITYLNGRMIQVKGFAMRSQNPWPAYGDAHAAWLCDFHHNLMVDIHANTVRPMQCAALKQEIESADRCGISYAMPAGDAEGDVTGGQWNQRAEAMRDAMVYFKNNPSVFYYEGGNSDITGPQMLALVDTMAKYDPNAGRATGVRGALNNASGNDGYYAQYGGEMMYIDKSRTKPMWNNEYDRDESGREFWDVYSPPYLHVSGANTTAGAAYDENQDVYCRESTVRWYEYWTERPGTSTGTGARVCSGGTKIEFADGTTFHRSSENYRKSGPVDGMRLPKDQYYAFGVFWNGWVEVDNKNVHIVGHWTYPAGTTKNVYVISNCAKVQLFVNGASKGYGTQSDKFLFTFPTIAYAAGSDSAQGYDSLGNAIATAHDSRTTAGAKTALRLTPHYSPAGLQATGNDNALVDVEVVDATGHRVDTATNMIAFTLSGPATWRGGMASGLVGTGSTFTNNSPSGYMNYIMATSLPVMCGINRVSIRTTTTPGTITLQATATGLPTATVTLTSVAAPMVIDTVGGLTTAMPGDGLPSRLDPLPPYQVLNPAPVYIMPTSSTASGGTPANTYSDNETLNWSGTTITYNFPQQLVSSVHLKVVGFSGGSTYPISIKVGTTTVFTGYCGGKDDDSTTNAQDNDPGGNVGMKGYWHHNFTPVSGSSVTIAATSGSVGIIEAEIYGPGVPTKVQPQSIQSTFHPAIRQLGDRLVLSMPAGAYKISMVDLSGREVFRKDSRESGNATTVSIATTKFARGAYLLTIAGAGENIQKKFILGK